MKDIVNDTNNHLLSSPHRTSMFLMQLIEYGLHDAPSLDFLSFVFGSLNWLPVTVLPRGFGKKYRVE